MTATKHIRFIMIFMILVIFALVSFITFKNASTDSAANNCKEKEEMFWKWDDVKSEIDELSSQEKLVIWKHLSEDHSQACY